MKTKIFKVLLGLTFIAVDFATAQQAYQPVAGQIMTKWAEEVSPTNALKEYPRPQMVRENWMNLNGLWDYSIVAKGSTELQNPQGKILVPYPIESALSGVKKPLLPKDELVYKRSFDYPALKKGERVLLHFGAVDWQTTVIVNGQTIGSHTGGYDAFSFDITAAVKKGKNEIVVRVWDPTDSGPITHGKQTLEPRWIRYNAVSGIWQTVWLEKVPEVSIAALHMTPDIDKGVLNLNVSLAGNTSGLQVSVHAARPMDKLIKDPKPVFMDSKSLAGESGAEFAPNVSDMHLWSPKDPFLYDLVVTISKNGKIIDQVSSYFGMRKIEVKKSPEGVEKVYLNNEPTFHLGVLDQGYWPDGLYTAATDEALKYDVQVIKDMGFNTIRKHIKIEPARWYYHCDKLGMMVWQDMPSWRQPVKMPQEAKDNFEAEMKRHMDNLHNSPSIIMWVLFNEDWGSFDQERLAKWMKKHDPSRVLNAHSGSFKDDFTASELTDHHQYPDPTLPEYEEGKAMVCGEFGGVYQVVPGHEWLPGKGWGHSSPPGFTFAQRYRQMMEHVVLLEKEGLSGTIFTEPFDVEIEENGFMSYDRKVFKFPLQEIKQINSLIKNK